jgi:hypothetical protein
LTHRPVATPTAGFFVSGCWLKVTRAMGAVAGFSRLSKDSHLLTGDSPPGTEKGQILTFSGRLSD